MNNMIVWIHLRVYKQECNTMKKVETDKPKISVGWFPDPLHLLGIRKSLLTMALRGKTHWRTQHYSLLLPEDCPASPLPSLSDIICLFIGLEVLPGPPTMFTNTAPTPHSPPPSRYCYLF